MDLHNTIIQINHSKEQRAFFAQLLMNDPNLVAQALQIVGDIHTETSYKAAWALEFLCKNKLDGILSHIDSFITLLPEVYHHSAVRPMAKICEYLIIAYYHDVPNNVQLSLQKTHREKITEACFDWLITDQKVAAKAYAMTCLQLLGTEFGWIHAELRNSIEKQYATQSAAFKARGRMVLKKLNS